MSVTSIHSFLVHPAHGESVQPETKGAAVPLSGKLYKMLRDLYEGADRYRDVGIIFRPTIDGRQWNPCRDLLLAYLRSPGIKTSRAIAQRLQAATTRRSGLGLLFLVCGKEDKDSKLLVARFPADEGVIAEEAQRRLTLTFIERVFMKNTHSYKSAAYRTSDLNAGLWDGVAVDRQIEGLRELSHYWIDGFLDSELRSTPAAGTKRLANALRQATSKVASEAARVELIAVSQLLSAADGKRLSPETVCTNMNLSEAATEALRSAMPRPELFAEMFEFSSEEYSRHIQYRSVELDNGARLVADNAKFDDVFRTEQAIVAEGRVRYITEGVVVNQKLRKDI